MHRKKMQVFSQNCETKLALCLLNLNCNYFFILRYVIMTMKELVNMVKQVAIDGIRTLPDNSTWDDIMYFLYVNQKIEKGLSDIENGAVFTNEEARSYLSKQ